MTEMQTAFFYLVVVAASSMLAHGSDVKNTPIGLVLAVALLVFVSGFRSYDVGVDTLGYKEGVEYFFAHGTQIWTHSFSDGYGWFATAVLTVNNDYTFLLVVEAIITCGLFAVRLWDFRGCCSLGFAMFVYTATVFPVSLCIICQSISISIVFFAGKYLDRDRPLRFAVLVLVASLIHVSALIGFCALALYLVKSKSATKGRFIMKMLMAVALLVASGIASFMLIDRYSGYSVNESDVGLMVFAQIAVLGGSLLMVGHFSDREKREAMSTQTHLALPLYFLGIVMSASSYVIANAGRIAYYFTVYSPVVFGYLTRDSSKDKSAFALAFLLTVWTLFYAWYAYLLHTGLGIESYSFVWMK